MRKTEAKPGKPAVMKLREDEEQLVIDWINKQTVYADSMRYLIQKEIAENGIRDIQSFVPRIRDVETIRQQLIKEKAEKARDLSSSVLPTMSNNANTDSSRTSIESNLGLDSRQKSNDFTSEEQQLENPLVIFNEAAEQPSVTQQMTHDGSSQDDQKVSTTTKRKAASKKFDSAVVGSFQ